MSLHEVVHERRQGIVVVSPSAHSISGAEGSRIVNGSNAEFAIAHAWLGWGSTSAEVVYTYSGTVSTAEDGQYDPDFVQRVLRADAAPIEATFDNVVDMLDWLERD